jgi:periplasmic mercuric ion binding protein
MKTITAFVAILFSAFISNSAAAQTQKNETIKVWGNCGICKKKIERAAKGAGATTASWNEETKELKVSYAAEKTSNMKIQEAVAKVGYDTQDVTANDKAYHKLDACCQYDRKATAKE